MRLFLCISVLFLLIQCSIGAANNETKLSTAKSVGPNSRKWFQKLSSKPSTPVPKTSLLDLSSELKLMILDNLDFPDLLNMSLVNKDFSNQVADVMRRKFRDIEIRLRVCENYPQYLKPSQPKSKKPETIFRKIMSQWKEEFYEMFFDEDPNEETPIYIRSPMRMIGNSLEIYDYNLTQVVLKKFGHMMRNIHFGSQYMEPHQVRTISELISKHCSDSLIELNIIAIDEGRLPLLARPFNRLIKVSFSFFKSEVASAMPTLDQLFPSLEWLSMDFCSEEMTHFDFLDCDLPHLQKLHVSALTESQHLLQDHLKRFLRRNSHIQAIILFNMEDLSPNFINIVHQLLPNLRQLIIDKFNIPNELRFEQVEMFQLTNLQPTASLDKLTLPKLKTLRLLYSDRENLFNDWRNFFRRHSHVTRLEFKEISKWNSDIGEHFEQLMNELPNLDTILAIFEDATIKADDICRFIESHANLKEMQFIVENKMTEEDKLTLLERLQGMNIWHIRHISSRSADNIYLKRKIS